MTTRFYELHGPEAEAGLRRLASRLAPLGLELRLLESREQAGLWLLSCRGEAPPDPVGPDRPLADLPLPGLRSWSFTERTLAGADPPPRTAGSRT